MPQVSKSENLREVGNKIRYYREKKKMSQLELAEAIGVTQNTIYLIETARSEMKLGKLFSIAEVLDVTPDKLLSSEAKTTSNKLIDTPERGEKLPTPKQLRTGESPVVAHVVQIWIAKDYLDVSDVKNFAYQVYWEKDDNLYWCKQLGISRVQIGNMAYRKNTDYERQRKDREKYILPDDLIKEFWKTNLKKLIVETESVIYAYSNFYVNKELSYEDLRKKARDAYSKLKDVYRTVVEVWFPLTDSDLKDYSKQSYDLAIDIQELLFLLNSDKGEEWVIGNFKLKLMKYYRSIEAWKEATDKLE